MRVKLDAARCDAWFDGELVRLCPQQFEVLAILVENAGRYVNRREFQRRMYGWDQYPLPMVANCLGTLVSRIRRQLGESGRRREIMGQGLIRSKPGFGYMVELDDVEVCPTCGRRA